MSPPQGTTSLEMQSRGCAPKGDDTLSILQASCDAFLGHSRTFLSMSLWDRGDSWGHPQQSLAFSSAQFPSEHPQGGDNL